MVRKRHKRKVKKKSWEEILADVYFTPGKSGAFFSVKKLQKILKFDFKISVPERKIQAWLESQYPYTIHRNRKLIFPRNPIIGFSIDHNWQADIGFFTKFARKNKGYTCFLLVIDVVSRFVWGEPLKSKKGPETSKAFETILKRSFPRKPEKLQTDGGTEFFNKEFKTVMKKNNIVLYKTQSDQKAAIAERAIKTIKGLIFKYLTGSQNQEWVSVFQNIIHTYNETFHSSIKMKPSEVNQDNQKEVLNNLYGFIWAVDRISQKKSKFEVGDFVRLSEVKKMFKKGYEGNWTDEIFQVSKIHKRNPFTVYEISDFENNEKIQGTFYGEELSKVNIKKKTYWRVEKIKRKEFRKKKLWFLVKFMNYDKLFWIPAENIADVEDVKKQMK